MRAVRKSVALVAIALGTAGLARSGAAQQGPALAHDSQPNRDSQPGLEARLEQLEQQLRILGRRLELARDSAAAAAKQLPRLKGGRDGFAIASADGDFQLKLRGYIQADGRFFLENSFNTLTNDFLLRRVRPLVEGTIYKYYDFRILADFGGGAPTIFDAYFQARFTPALTLRAGKFKPALGLERLQSATDTKFAERGLPTNLVPSRDVGLQVGGELGGGALSYSAAVFNGVPDLASGLNDISDAKDLVGRLFLVPFARQDPAAPVDVGVGIAASTGNERGTTAATGLASYRSPGQATIFRYIANSPATIAGTVLAGGRRTRISPQGYLNLGSLGILAEYVISRQTVTRDTAASVTQTSRLEHRAWEVTGSYLLTGEKASFASITPKTQFDPLAGAWGAVELVARFGVIDFDDAAFPSFADPATSVTRATAWGIGLNWYLARGVKLVVDFERSRFEGSAPGGFDRPTERNLTTRFQTSF